MANFSCEASDVLEWRRLSAAAKHVHPGLVGDTANWVVKPLGEAASLNGYRYIRALCVAPGSMKMSGDPKVLLKINEADWMYLQWSDKPWKILQAKLYRDPLWCSPLLDCSDSSAAIVSHISTGDPEVQSVIEFFAGGFLGWTQGGYILHTLGLPSSIKWGIEVDESCLPMQRAMLPSHVTIRNVQDMHAAVSSHACHPMILGDVRDNWWLRMFQLLPGNTWAVSPPCQPWSSAGREGGLSSALGQLFFRIADLAAVFQPEVLLIEQVAGFALHRDYSTVLRIFSDAGFQLCWKGTLELVHLLPCHRNRHLLVFRRSNKQLEAPRKLQWASPRASTLRTALALFELPASILQSCLLSPEELDMYLCPELLPSTSHRFNRRGLQLTG